MSDFDNIPIEYYEEETEMLQMWLEKLNRPGRVIARNCNEISEWELKYNLVNDDDVEKIMGKVSFALYLFSSFWLP